MNEFDLPIWEKWLSFWITLSKKKKQLFVTTQVVFFITIVSVLFTFYDRSKRVVLVTLDNPAQLDRIASLLTEEGIHFDRFNDRIIRVDQGQKSRAALCLAQNGLIDSNTEVGWKLFDPASSGTIDSATTAAIVFDIQRKRTLQNALENALVSGSENIAEARVTIVFANDTLQDGEIVEPSASVKLILKNRAEIVSSGQVSQIQNLIACAVPHLETHRVCVVNQDNRLLSGTSILKIVDTPVRNASEGEFHE